VAIPPPQIDGNDHDGRGDTFLKVAWSSVPLAVQYTVSCGSQAQTFAMPGVPFTTEFQGLTPDTAYTIEVKAVDPLNQQISDVKATISTRPRAPSFVHLAAPVGGSRQSDRLVLEWEQVPGAPLYEVQIVGGAVVTAAYPGAGGFALTGLAANTSYAVTVRSRDDPNGGVSYDSPTLTELTRPPTPAGLALTPIPISGVQVRWDAVPSFPGIGASAIQLGRAEGIVADPLPFDGTFSVAGGTWVDHFIDDGRNFTYGIRVVAGSNQSFWYLAIFPANRWAGLTRGDVLSAITSRQQDLAQSLARALNRT
jgi:hypothetical protein